MKKISLSLLLLMMTLVGCSASLVPTTSDPSKMLDQAYVLIDTDTPLPAENLIDDAFAVYQKEGNEFGMAEAYYAYGNLYKTDSYHAFPRAGERRVKTKEEAIGYFRKALALYVKHHDDLGAAKCQFGIGQVYGATGKKAEACTALDESLSSYNKAKKLDPSAGMPFRTKETDFSKVVQYTKEGVGCGAVDKK